MFENRIFGRGIPADFVFVSITEFFLYLQSELPEPPFLAVAGAVFLVRLRLLLLLLLLLTGL